MLVAFWSVKGGVGTTVSTALCALSWAAADCEVLLVDLVGELPAVLGCPGPDSPGYSDLVAQEAVPSPSALRRIETEVADGLNLLRRGGGPAGASIVSGVIVEGLVNDRRLVAVDCGQRPAGEQPTWAGGAVLDAADHSWLVARACYLGLSRTVGLASPPDAVFLVSEPGRALCRSDVAAAIGAPVIAEVALDPRIARAVDAGLLTTHLPRGLPATLQSVRPRG